MAVPPPSADPIPAAAAEQLTCKACTRTLATISTDGELQPHGALDEGCALCKDMFQHCSEYEEVKGYFKELEHRRDDYGPRQLALEVVHQAQMNLGNFIQRVALWGDEDGEETEGLAGEQHAGEQEEEVQQAQDQPTTPSADTHPALPIPQSRSKHPRTPHSSPPRKRTKRARLSERNRRVSFDPSVVFRDGESPDRRVDAEFSRNSEGYAPGRWAAPEGSEWLDTSGNTLRETQFFGVQKRGGSWVATKLGMEMDEEWERAGREEEDDHEAKEGGNEDEEAVNEEGQGGNEAQDGDRVDQQDALIKCEAQIDPQDQATEGEPKNAPLSDVSS